MRVRRLGASSPIEGSRHRGVEQAGLGEEFMRDPTFLCLVERHHSALHGVREFAAEVPPCASAILTLERSATPSTLPPPPDGMPDRVVLMSG